MTPTITETKQGWKVVAKIVGGSRSDVAEAVKQYLTRYPYAGYGTTGGTVYPYQDGQFIARVERSKSAG